SLNEALPICRVCSLARKLARSPLSLRLRLFTEMRHQLVVTADTLAVEEDLRGGIDPLFLLEQLLLGGIGEHMYPVGYSMLVQQCGGLVSKGAAFFLIDVILRVVHLCFSTGDPVPVGRAGRAKIRTFIVAVARSDGSLALFEGRHHLRDDAHHGQVGFFHLAEMLHGSLQRALVETAHGREPLAVYRGMRPFDLPEVLELLDALAAVAVVPPAEAAFALAGQSRQGRAALAQQVVVD